MKSEWKYLYGCAPVDWWEEAVSESEYIRKLIHFEKMDGVDLVEDFVGLIVEGITLICREEENAGRDGWCGIWVTGLPDGGNPNLLKILIAKEINNGTIYVLSPIELVHLKEHEIWREKRGK